MEAVFQGAFFRLRAALGVKSFGMQVIEMPPSYDGYPEHDHGEDGQEEVYVILDGDAEIEIDDQRLALGPDVFIRVGPHTRRKLFSGSRGVRLLVLGGVPSQAYVAPEFTELGQPDPMAEATS